MLIIDLIIVTIYVGGFYIVKYRIPKQLETNTKSNNEFSG